MDALLCVFDILYKGQDKNPGSRIQYTIYQIFLFTQRDQYSHHKQILEGNFFFRRLAYCNFDIYLTLLASTKLCCNVKNIGSNIALGLYVHPLATLSNKS